MLRLAAGIWVAER